MSLTIGTTADGDAFTLPLDAATQKFAFLAKSGAGKTYAATKLAESMHAAGIPIVALDPVGVWYGLRLAADGEGPGIAIPVFGGEYGDIPLEPSSGAMVADLVVERGISVVLDVSSFRKAQRKQFVTEFAEELFHRKKTARSPLHLFLEEAQSFVPQRAISGEERMLGAFEDIGKIGRNYGIGLTLISQRPQSVHKDVLNQAECLFVLQLNAALERKAIREWIDAQGIDAGAAVDELPGLKIGEAFVWSPQWLKFFGKVRILPKHTYNASATPTFDTAAVAPRALDPSDLGALREAMQAMVERVEAHDPTALKKRIAELERQLRERPAPAAPAPLDDQVARLERIVTDLAGVARQLGVVARHLESAHAGAAAPVKPARSTPTRPASKPAPRSAPAPVAGGAKLPAPQQRILDALIAFEGLGLRRVARHHVAIWSKQSPTSSAYGNNLGGLRSAGLIDYPASGYVALTEAGRRRARPTAPIRSIDQLHQAWIARLPAPQGRILRVLITQYPRAVERTRLAELTDQSPTSSAYGNNLGALRSLGLVDYPQPGRVAATSLLFPRLQKEG
jgi:uncharacterized protein